MFPCKHEFIWLRQSVGRLPASFRLLLPLCSLSGGTWDRKTLGGLDLHPLQTLAGLVCADGGGCSSLLVPEVTVQPFLAASPGKIT